MADDRHYVPGDFYRICERSGRKVRAGRTSKEWTGHIVRNESWEPRHPQDFVRGRKDPQNVPEPRPRQPDRFIDPERPVVAGQAYNYATTGTNNIYAEGTPDLSVPDDIFSEN